MKLAHSQPAVIRRHNRVECHKRINEGTFLPINDVNGVGCVIVRAEHDQTIPGNGADLLDFALNPGKIDSARASVSFNSKRCSAVQLVSNGRYSRRPITSTLSSRSMKLTPY